MYGTYGYSIGDLAVVYSIFRLVSAERLVATLRAFGKGSMILPAHLWDGGNGRDDRAPPAPLAG